MELTEFVLLLIEGLGGVLSKDKIHKSCYIYSTIHKTDFDFNRRYYGFYSPKVEKALDEMQEIGLVDVDFSQNCGYSYSINRFSREVISKISTLANNFEEIKKIKDFNSKVKEAGGIDNFELAIATKTFCDGN